MYNICIYVYIDIYVGVPKEVVGAKKDGVKHGFNVNRSEKARFDKGIRTFQQVPRSPRSKKAHVQIIHSIHKQRHM